MKKDNTTLGKKVALRREVLARLEETAEPVVMETHGGLGKVWQRVYSHIPTGIVMEKNPDKARMLAMQRPGWAVYETDTLPALLAGAGDHLVVNLLDVDPYGDAWPVIQAFLSSARPKAEELWIVVNDGLKYKIKLAGADTCATTRALAEEFGPNLQHIYLECCQVLMEQKAAQAGYRLSRFAGYYCGRNDQMTHYAARLTR